jgi:hypothetical protein
MIRKVYEVDPMICPRCGGRMRVVAFLTDHAVVDRIIRHLELTFVAENPRLAVSRQAQKGNSFQGTSCRSSSSTWD